MKKLNISAHNIIRGGSSSLLLNIINDLSSSYSIKLLIPSDYEDFKRIERRNVEIYIYPNFLNKLIFKAISNYVVLPVFWLITGGRNPIFNVGNVAFPTTGNNILLLHNAYPFYLKTIFNLSKTPIFSKINMIIMAVFIRVNLYFANTIVVQTETMRKKLDNLGYISQIFPNKINLEKQFVNNKTSKINRILFMSNFHYHKNFDIVIDAAKELSSKLPYISFLFTLDITNKSDRDLIERLNELHLPNIHNIGKINSEDIPSLLSEVDCMINPSLIESFSTNYIEAFAFGLPIIVSDTDFAREICKDAGIYFDPYNYADLVNTIIDIHDDLEFLTKVRYSSLMRFEYYKNNAKEVNYDFLKS